MEKKILFIVTQSEMGGAQRYIMETALVLRNKGYKVLVAAGGKDNTLVSKKLKHLKRNFNPFQAILGIFEIRKLLKQEQPDVLFLCSTMAGILGSLASISHSLRVIYRIGGWAFRDPRPFWQRKLIIFLEKLTARLKDKIIVNSEVDYKAALEYKIAKPEKLVKIHNGINPAELTFLPKQAAIQAVDKLWTSDVHSLKNGKIVGTVANFYKTKGLEYLIEAMKDNQLSIINYHLLIIGDGPERKNLESQIKQLELGDKIHLAGRIEQARKYLKAFDVFVLPSLKEGFPWVILEAMAAGVPIIATNVGAVPEIIEDDKSGLLVEPSNSEMLAKKIQQVLENPQLTNQLAEAAKQRLNHFSKDKMIDETLKLIL